MVTFYEKLPDMECCAGDTLLDFEISVEADSLEDCRMQCILSKSADLITAAICKECTAIDGGFIVTLTNKDTGRLAEGMYSIHFRLIDSNGLNYIKLRGNLYVRSAARGTN